MRDYLKDMGVGLLVMGGMSALGLGFAALLIKWPAVTLTPLVLFVAWLIGSLVRRN